MSEDLKRCSKCGIILLKSNFYAHKLTKYKLYPSCKVCVIQEQNDYYSKNRDRINNTQKIYNKQNRAKINSNERKRRQLDNRSRLNENTRCRIQHALNSNSKSFSTLDFFGIDIETYRKWIEYQMTLEMDWTNIEIDHVKPVFTWYIQRRRIERSIQLENCTTTS